MVIVDKSNSDHLLKCYMKSQNFIEFALMTTFVIGHIQVGVIPMDESKVVMKGRLGPGMMITVDLQSGQVRIETENLFPFLPLTAA